MQLAKSSLLAVSNTSVKLISALVITKLVALYTGPAGIAILGQFLSISSLIAVTASLGVSQGIVVLTAQAMHHQTGLGAVFNMGIRIALVGSFGISLLLITLQSQLGQWIFATQNWNRLFSLSALMVFFLSTGAISTAFLVGANQQRTILIIQLLSAILACTIALLTIARFDIAAAIGGIVIGQIMTSLLSLWSSKSILRKSPLRADKPATPSAAPQLTHMFQYGLITFTTASLGPLSHIIVRGTFTETAGIEAAGYWQCLLRLSEVFSSLLTAVLGMSYLPAFARITHRHEATALMKQYIFRVIPALGVALIIASTLRYQLMRAIFTSNFDAVADLLPTLLFGDLVRSFGLIVGYFMIAKGRTRNFIIAEILFISIYIFATTTLIRQHGLAGAITANLLTATIYTASMLTYWFSTGRRQLSP